MKKFSFSLLSFLTGVYFTIGGYSLLYYLLFLAIKKNRRANIIESEALVVPHYPLIFEIGFYASLVAFFVIGYILTHVTVKQSKYLNSTAILKFTLFVILVLSGFFVARESINVWEATPPMSKERAIQIAIEENSSGSTLTSEYSRTIFRSIQWSGNRWIVEISDQKGIHCDHISISRLGTSVTGGSCNE